MGFPLHTAAQNLLQNCTLSTQYCHLEFLHNRKFVWFQLGVYKYSKNLGTYLKIQDAKRVT